MPPERVRRMRDLRPGQRMPEFDTVEKAAMPGMVAGSENGEHSEFRLAVWTHPLDVQRVLERVTEPVTAPVHSVLCVLSAERLPFDDTRRGKNFVDELHAVDADARLGETVD